MPFEEDRPNDKNEKVDNVINELRDRFGSGCIMRANLLHSGFSPMAGGYPRGNDIPTMRSEL